MLKRVLFIFCLIFLGDAPLALAEVQEKAPPSEYVLSPDDPISTYRVSVKDLHMMRDPYLDKEVPVDEYVKKYSDKNVHRTTKAAAQRNLFLKKNDGLLWNEAILNEIETGGLFTQKDGKEVRIQYYPEAITGSARNAWGKRRKDGTLDVFLTRMKAHAKAVNARLSNNAIVSKQYIRFYFKHSHPEVVSPKDGTHCFYFWRTLGVPAMSSISKNKDILKNSQTKDKELLIKIQDSILEFEKDTGLGFSQDYLASLFSGGWGVKFLPDGIFYIDIPINKKGFREYYNISALHNAPPYLYDLNTIAVNKHYRQVYRNRAQYLLHNHDFRITDEYIDEMLSEEQKQQIQNELREKGINDYSFKFIRSERRIEFSYSYKTVSGYKDDKSPQNAALGFLYEANAKYSKNNEIVDIDSFFSDMRLSALSMKYADEVKSPYFPKYSSRQIKKCKPYFDWHRCHKTKVSPASRCKNVPSQEPEMCK